MVALLVVKLAIREGKLLPFIVHPYDVRQGYM